MSIQYSIVYEVLDAQRAARHDFPDDKFGEGYLLITTNDKSTLIDIVYSEEWQRLLGDRDANVK